MNKVIPEYLRTHYCKCGKKIGYNTYRYGLGRCRSCANKGKNNPMHGKHPWNYGKKLNKNYRLKLSKSHIGQKAWNKNKKTGNCFSKEGLQRLSEKTKIRQRGKNNSNWRGGTNHLPYVYNWNEIAITIRNKYNYKCQLCFKKADEVHHIDYCKQNCNDNNLILLCDGCHGKTNGNRDYWYAYFMYIKEGEKNG